MAIQHANTGIVKKDLQLYYNREFQKSFRGEATTNIVSNTTDFSGLSYAGYSTEWTADPTRFTKTYNSNLQTPIGTGATLLTESGTAGYHHLSRLGGGGTGGHSISCYVYPVNGSITNFTIGMLGDGGSTAIFNLATGVVVSTGVRVSNAFITKVSGWLGWYRVGANIGGREGGWVGAVGLDVQTSYTPSLPYKSMYVTGLQYEDTKTYCTPFVVGSRSANTVAGGGGLLDISGNNVNANLTNVVFDSAGYYFTAAGSNYINTGITTLPNNTQLTIDVWTKPTSTTQAKTLVSKWGSSSQSNFCFLLFLNFFAQGNIYFLVGDSAGTNYSTHSIPHNLSTSAYSNFTVVYDNGLVSWYRNGVFIQTDTNGNKPLKSVTTAITIGADYDGGNPDTLTRSYDGTIPNVRLYSRPLTAAEVLQNFNATRKTYGI